MKILKKMQGCLEPPYLKNVVNFSGYRDKPINILDIGCGNKSSLRIKKYVDCHYVGIDIDERNQEELNQLSIDEYYYCNLDKDFPKFNDCFFDYINFCHVAEHLDYESTQRIIREAYRILRPGGALYIEYPNEGSTKLPSMRGTLNFYDDSTHKTILSTRSLLEYCEQIGYKVVKNGKRRDYVRIIGLPALVARSLIHYRYVAGSCFWDLLGFADYLYCVKDAKAK